MLTDRRRFGDTRRGYPLPLHIFQTVLQPTPSPATGCRAEERISIAGRGRGHFFPSKLLDQRPVKLVMMLISSGTKLTLHYRYNIKVKNVWSFASVFPIPLLLLVLNSVKRKIHLTHFKHVRKTAKNDYSIRRVCPSDRPSEQLGSHWTDFHEIWYLNIFRNSVGEI